jgi:hypothetical protein
MSYESLKARIEAMYDEDDISWRSVKRVVVQDWGFPAVSVLSRSSDSSAFVNLPVGAVPAPGLDHLPVAISYEGHVELLTAEEDGPAISFCDATGRMLRDDDQLISAQLKYAAAQVEAALRATDRDGALWADARIAAITEAGRRYGRDHLPTGMGDRAAAAIAGIEQNKWDEFVIVFASQHRVVQEHGMLAGLLHSVEQRLDLSPTALALLSVRAWNASPDELAAALLIDQDRAVAVVGELTAAGLVMRPAPTATIMDHESMDRLRAAFAGEGLKASSKRALAERAITALGEARTRQVLQDAGIDVDRAYFTPAAEPFRNARYGREDSRVRRLHDVCFPDRHDLPVGLPAPARDDAGWGVRSGDGEFLVEVSRPRQGAVNFDDGEGQSGRLADVLSEAADLTQVLLDDPETRVTAAALIAEAVSIFVRQLAEATSE